MSLGSKLATLAIAAVAVVATALPAFAATAYASTTLNVRSCGSTSCRVIDVLRRGEPVDVRYCEGGWCAISQRGPNGWVNANYLVRDGYYEDDYYEYVPPRRVRPVRPVYPAYPVYPRRHYYDPGFSACVGGPNAQFCIYD